MYPSRFHYEAPRSLGEAFDVLQVWKHMQDVPRIAPCLPGAELTDVNGDVYKGSDDQDGADS